MMEICHLNKPAGGKEDISARAASADARHLSLYLQPFICPSPLLLFSAHSMPGKRITVGQSSQTAHPLSFFHRCRAAIASWAAHPAVNTHRLSSWMLWHSARNPLRFGPGNKLCIVCSLELGMTRGQGPVARGQGPGARRDMSITLSVSTVHHLTVFIYSLFKTI